MDGDVIRMIVAAMRIEGDDDVRADVVNHREDGRLDLQHVDVRQGPRIVASEALLARRIVEPQEARRVELEDLARAMQLRGPMGAEIADAGRPTDAASLPPHAWRRPA